MGNSSLFLLQQSTTSRSRSQVLLPRPSRCRKIADASAGAARPARDAAARRATAAARSNADPQAWAGGERGDIQFQNCAENYSSNSEFGKNELIKNRMSREKKK